MQGVKERMIACIERADILTKLYGFQDSDDGIASTEDDAFVAFPLGILTPKQIMALERELKLEFGECEIHVPQA